jgi:glycosyltransferase involved in cell wall biosynthesis
MINKKKVLIDVSVLYLGEVDEKARTGVYRYISNVFDAMLENHDWEIFGFSSYSLDTLPDVQSFFLNHPKYKNIPFLFPFTFQLAWKIRSIEKKFRYRNNLFLKAVSLFLILMRKIIEKLHFLFFLKFDIYFSPYHPIPNYINKKFTKRFITIYDLIPIKFPEFFENKSRHLIHDVIDSIHKNDGVFCISESTKKDLLEYRLDLSSEKVLVTYLAASQLFYRVEDKSHIKSICDKYNIPNDYILSVCTLEPRKNIVSVIKAFSHLLSSISNRKIYLVLVGTKGWDFNSIFEQISTNPEIQNRVIVTGYVKDSDLAPLYSGAICFVYPSLYEGFGLPPLESMQCATPVITSNNSSLPEVVGNAGLLVEAKDFQAIANSLEKLIEDKPFRESLSEKSLLRAKEFSWDKCKQQMKDFISSF